MSALKHVFRGFGLAPAFTAIALVTLALGIGANTAIFSVINGVLIKPLPFPHSQELVSIWHAAPGLSGVIGDLDCSPGMYFTYREENRTFQEFGLWENRNASVTGVGDPEELRALLVTYGTLQALGVQPAVGQWISQADDTPGSPETVMLTFGYWQRRFGGDNAVVGRTLMVDSKPRTVVGVMPRDFRFLDLDPELILPERFDRNTLYLGSFGQHGIARLKSGVTLQQANADLGRMLGIWLQAWPVPPGASLALFENARLAPKMRPLKDDVVGDVGATLWVLMGTIGLVLLIACANVANLLLVRAEGRQQEFAIRAALGAGWGRIAREMLLESLTLGVLGGVLGLGLAYGSVRILVAKGPATLPRLTEIGIDPLVLAFSLAASLLAGLLFGLIPVIKYAGTHLATALRAGGRSQSASRERHRARNTLVAVQVALALVLLVGSGLMIRTFQALRNIQPGFTRPAEIQLMRIAIPQAQVKEPERVMRMQNEIMDWLAAIPGVTSVSFTNSAPLEGLNYFNPVIAQDKIYAAGEIAPMRRFRFIAPGFFKTTGTAILAGRDFTWTDLYEKRNVAMVSENMAREMWGEPAAALGKHIRDNGNTPWREIVGVVTDVYDNGVQEKPPSFAYWPALMDNFWGPTRVQRTGAFLIRTNRAATESFLTEARQAVWSVDSSLPVFQVRTLQDLYNQSLARTAFTLVLLAIAGAMALILGIIGIYGVIAYTVTRRTREIGIRMALGAQAAGLRKMFVRQGLVLAGIGAVIGLGAAAGLTRLMASLLFGVAALDPLTYAGVAAILIGAAALASYVPARRASRVDPLDALRAE